MNEESGELRSSLDSFSRLVGQQLKLAKELLVTPAALGSLKGDQPDDLAAAFARNIGDGEVVDADNKPE